MPKWRPISIQHDFYTPFICVTMSDQIDSKARNGSRAKTMPFIVGLAPINCLISKRTPSKRWLHTMALYEGVKIYVFIERQNADFVIFWVTFNSWSICFSTATRGCKPITKLIVSVPNTNKNPKNIWIFLIIGSASGSRDFTRFGPGGSTLSRFPCKTPIGKVGTSQYTFVTKKLA